MEGPSHALHHSKDMHALSGPDLLEKKTIYFRNWDTSDMHDSEFEKFVNPDLDIQKLDF